MAAYQWIIIVITAGLSGLVLGYIIEKYLRFRLKQKIKQKVLEAEQTAKKIINVAKAEGKVEAALIRQEAKDETDRKRIEFLERERFSAEREQLFHEREEGLNKKEQGFFRKQNELETTTKYYKELVEESITLLEKVSGYSRDEAKEILFKEIGDKYQLEIGAFLKNAETVAKLTAKNKAIDIITIAIERYATDTVIEKTTAVLELEDDNMKGRIIGKDGRNIKTFELATGVDLIIDDTPNQVQLSSFNPIRREIARRALEKLVLDGRIQPNRIEEVVKSEQNDFDVLILDVGRQTVEELGITNIDLSIIQHLGMLKFRTSYGQNVLLHSIEVAKLAGIMASELGLEPSIAIRAGLLHDIGKAIDFENEGSHVTLGVKLATKCNESDIIINAIHSHHGEIPPTNPYSVLVSAADTISAARPGSRNNTLENYITRMKELETICESIPGVDHAYVVQAGRQIRVIVNPVQKTDEETHKLAYDIREKIKANKSVPGDIVITIIRELRITETII
ncbi:ribonuclease Y [Spiroplasma chrysopicola]|uniref:Ribonuclease Y n=1 Tax=Spiroplasma chrysopicola DF-1 TaxID=1276227 RepID=R4UHV0_9MOLU|nr:ribonuclease Y [Spiroplasma chrysopicola]AGM24901.1 hypothetical protein SCHRY_v1c03160 [Spiroplasma chrysopicola DF-1]